MINEYKNIHEMNVDYGDAIMVLAEHSKKSNDEIKQCMLDELMRDYNANLKIINLNNDFIKKQFIKNKKLEQRQSKLDFKYKKKQKNYDYKQNKKKNKHVLYCYKKLTKKTNNVNMAKENKLLKQQLKNIGALALPETEKEKKL